MRILHRLGFYIKPFQRFELERLGVKLLPDINMPGGGDPFVAFDVPEDHPHWSQIKSTLEAWGHWGAHMVSTEFTTVEIAVAQWLEISAHAHGYPQPDEGNFGYWNATYDVTYHCEKCGTGLKQNAPFQMKREPKWGRNGLVHLNWVFDELFVRPEVWSAVFQLFGVACRPVINTKGVELKTVVQLVIDDFINIKTEGLESEQCERCNRIKYLPVTRGLFPPMVGVPKSAMVKTVQYFGSGGRADQALLISQDIARALTAAKVRGAYLTPLAT